MTTLCKMFCPDDLRREMEILRERKAADDKVGTASATSESQEIKTLSGSEHEEEEEEGEEEEKEEEGE